MTSVQRYANQIGKDVPKVLGVSGPRYTDSSLNNLIMLFPFIYSNGVLDLNYIDSFYTDMVAIPNQSPVNSSCDDVPLSRAMGGLGMVTTIGPNLVEYLNAWLGNAPGTVYTIYRNGTVTKVQTYLPQDIYTDEPYTITTIPPDSDTYPWGSPNSEYRTTWIFRTPLTIRYIDSGNVTQYLTLTSTYNIDTC